MTPTTDFGRDLLATTQLFTGRSVTGPILVAAALVRRITTPRGRLYFHRGYGRDVRELLGAAVGPNWASSVEAQLKAECLKEPRVIRSSLKVSVTEIKGPTGSRVEIAIEGSCAAGPFDFVLSVDKVTLALLGVRFGGAS